MVLPESITWKPTVSTEKVMKLKVRVRKQGNPTPYRLDLLRYLQFTHINDILSRPLEESCPTKVIENFKWTDWVNRRMVMAHPIKRTSGTKTSPTIKANRKP